MSENTTDIIWKDRKHHMWFPLSFTKYEIKKDRLYSQTGFFKTVSEELLLYKVVDISLTRTLFQKIFGTGTICITARIDKHDHLHLENIKNSTKVKELLSDVIEEVRDRKKVTGKEFYGSALDGDFDMD